MLHPSFGSLFDLKCSSYASTLSINTSVVLSQPSRCHTQFGTLVQHKRLLNVLLLQQQHQYQQGPGRSLFLQQLPQYMKLIFDTYLLHYTVSSAKIVSMSLNGMKETIYGTGLFMPFVKRFCHISQCSVRLTSTP